MKNGGGRLDLVAAATAQRPLLHASSDDPTSPRSPAPLPLPFQLLPCRRLAASASDSYDEGRLAHGPYVRGRGGSGRSGGEDDRQGTVVKAVDPCAAQARQ